MDYKDKLRLAKEALDSGSYDKETIEYIFPELKESEDKIIIDALKSGFKLLEAEYKLKGLGGIKFEKILAWLEKQGEQKPYGLREECKDCQCNYAGECKGSCAMKRNEQKPWSEEDERLFQIIIDILDKEENKGHLSHTDLIACVRKLKYIRPQTTWKPSDEQMVALNNAILLNEDHYNGAVLSTLREQLKKLRGNSYEE